MILELLQLNVGILVAVEAVAAAVETDGESASQSDGQVGLPVQPCLCFVTLTILVKSACLVEWAGWVDANAEIFKLVSSRSTSPFICKQLNGNVEVNSAAIYLCHKMHQPPKDWRFSDIKAGFGSKKKTYLRWTCKYKKINDQHRLK